MSCSTTLLSNYMCLLLRNWQVNSVLYADELGEAIEASNQMLRDTAESCKPSYQVDHLQMANTEILSGSYSFGPDSFGVYILAMPSCFKAIRPSDHILIAESHAVSKKASSEGFLSIMKACADDLDDTEDLAIFSVPDSARDSTNLSLQVCADPVHDAPTQVFTFAE